MESHGSSKIAELPLIRWFGFFYSLYVQFSHYKGAIATKLMQDGQFQEELMTMSDKDEGGNG